MALGDREDGWIKWQSDGRVSVLIGRLLPQGSAERQTPAGRSDFGMRWQNASARHQPDLPVPPAAACPRGRRHRDDARSFDGDLAGMLADAARRPGTTRKTHRHRPAPTFPAPGGCVSLGLWRIAAAPSCRQEFVKSLGADAE